MRGAAFIAAAIVGVGVVLAAAAVLEIGAASAGLGSLAVTAVVAISYVLTSDSAPRRELRAPTFES